MPRESGAAAVRLPADLPRRSALDAAIAGTRVPPESASSRTRFAAGAAARPGTGLLFDQRGTRGRSPRCQPEGKDRLERPLCEYARINARVAPWCRKAPENTALSTGPRASTGVHCSFSHRLLALDTSRRRKGVAVVTRPCSTPAVVGMAAIPMDVTARGVPCRPWGLHAHALGASRWMRPGAESRAGPRCRRRAPPSSSSTCPAPRAAMWPKGSPRVPRSSTRTRPGDTGQGRYPCGWKAMSEKKPIR